MKTEIAGMKEENRRAVAGKKGKEKGGEVRRTSLGERYYKRSAFILEGVEKGNVLILVGTVKRKGKKATFEKKSRTTQPLKKTTKPRRKEKKGWGLPDVRVSIRRTHRKGRRDHGRKR